MDRKEHIHIISAGEKIHVAYPALFRTLPTITRTYVLADSEVYTLASDPGIEKGRLAVRHAVDSVKEISASLSIPFARETVFPPTYPSVRTILAKIHREYPEARYSFDLSGGSKQLTLAIFSFAPWSGAEVYATFDEKVPRNVPLPDHPVRSLLTNPNYQKILAMLLRPGIQKPERGIHQWVSREYLYKQLWSVYIPSRTKKATPGEPPAIPAKNKRGTKPAAELSHGTLSTLLHSLEEAGLVLEETASDTKREKIYQITERGEIAFRFYASAATSTLVQTVLDKN